MINNSAADNSMLEIALNLAADSRADIRLDVGTAVG